MHKPTYTVATLLATSFLLTACGGESTDEPLPEGATPNEVERVEAEPKTSKTTDSGDADADDDVAAPEADTPKPNAETPEYPPLPTPPAAADDVERSKAPGMTYALPEGWTVGPARQMRLLTLLPPGDTSADLAISKWPGDVGGFPSNVNRWARQVGLPPIPGLMTAATSDFEKFEIDGVTATWIPLMNEDTGRAILAVWVPIGDEPENPDQTWTFKLTCQTDQVEALAPAIRAWCESIKFED